MLFDFKDSRAVFDKVLEYIGKLFVVFIAEDNISLKKLLCLVGIRLRHTACENNNAVGILPFEASYGLTGFLVSGSSNRAGIYNNHIGFLFAVYDFISSFFQAFAYCLTLVLINLTAEGVEFNFHFNSTLYYDSNIIKQKSLLFKMFVLIYREDS